MIKRRENGRSELVDTNPKAETVLREGDIVIAMGTDEQLSRFERD
jgi:K+/H+ antiporter YhaU regulatory subunit KhtT